MLAAQLWRLQSILADPLMGLSSEALAPAPNFQDALASQILVRRRRSKIAEGAEDALHHFFQKNATSLNGCGEGDGSQGRIQRAAGGLHRAGSLPDLGPYNCEGDRGPQLMEGVHFDPRLCSPDVRGYGDQNTYRTWREAGRNGIFSIHGGGPIVPSAVGMQQRLPSGESAFDFTSAESTQAAAAPSTLFDGLEQRQSFGFDGLEKQLSFDSGA